MVKRKPSELFSVAGVLLLTLAGQLVPPSAVASTGRVVSVIDGDTIEVLIDGESTRVRVEGIDCPESGQPFSSRARQLTASLVFGNTVRLEGVSKDRYKRRIARVRFLDVDGREADLSLRLVGAGLAWHFKRYSDDSTLAGAERTARERRLGLWSAPSPEPPWQFRLARRESAGSSRRATRSTLVEEPFSGNRRSRVFHRQACRQFSCPNCVRGFATRSEAIEAGFRPCGNCRP